VCAASHTLFDYDRKRPEAHSVMKVVLVVASGVHTGKEIAIPGTLFVIGRDEGCNLRPASPAISKRHCSIAVKNHEVFIEDLGSTNGTIVNEVAIVGEQKLSPGDRVKVGPLDFTLKFTLLEKKSDSTPLPVVLKAMTAAKDSKAGSSAAMPKVEFPAKPAPAAKPTPSRPIPKAATAAQDEQDNIAAMLLGMDDDDSENPHVPEGSTVMEMPAVLADAAGEKKRTVPEQPDSSAVARDLLSRLTRRPR